MTKSIRIPDAVHALIKENALNSQLSMAKYVHKAVLALKGKPSSQASFDGSKIMEGVNLIIEQTKPKTRAKAKPKVAVETAIDPQTGMVTVVEKEGSKGSQVFNTYVAAMKRAKGDSVQPSRNVKVNTQLKKMIEAIGFDNALLVADNYPFHKSYFYTKNSHPIGLMLSNCESLLTECQSMNMVTEKSARLDDDKGYSENCEQVNSRDPKMQELW